MSVGVQWNRQQCGLQRLQSLQFLILLPLLLSDQQLQRPVKR